MKTLVKITLGTALAACLSTQVFAQQVLNDNINNSSSNPFATSNGLVWTNTGSGLGLLNQDINVQLLGGANASSVTNVISTMLITDSSGAGDGWLPGQFNDPTGNIYTVPGVADNVNGFFQLYFWFGNETSYAQAVSDGLHGYGTTGIFQNPTGGGGSPNTVPTDLSGMPAIIVPEPGSLALAGLGVLTLLAFRRRN